MIFEDLTNKSYFESIENLDDSGKKCSIGIKDSVYATNLLIQTLFIWDFHARSESQGKSQDVVNRQRIIDLPFL